LDEKEREIERLQIEVERLGSVVGELQGKAEERVAEECKATDQRL
jgi:hypothetical protein